MPKKWAKRARPGSLGPKMSRKDKVVLHRLWLREECAAQEGGGSRMIPAKEATTSSDLLHEIALIDVQMNELMKKKMVLDGMRMRLKRKLEELEGR